jgi:hypothetical protein
MSPAHFALANLEIGSCFLPRLAWTTILLFYSYAITGMTGMRQHTWLFSIEIGSHELFCLGWPGTMILLISASCIAWNDRCATVLNYWLRWEFHKLCSGWPQTAVLLISASQVARITGVSHWYPAWKKIL